MKNYECRGKEKECKGEPYPVVNLKTGGVIWVEIKPEYDSNETRKRVSHFLLDKFDEKKSD